MRSRENDRAKAIKQLEKDLMALFCMATMKSACSADFCRIVSVKENHQAGDNSTNENDTVEDASSPETLSSKFLIGVKHGICNHLSQCSDGVNVLSNCQEIFTQCLNLLPTLQPTRKMWVGLVGLLHSHTSKLGFQVKTHHKKHS